MKIIVYKKREDHYECTDIKDDGSDEASIIFDEPIFGTLVLNDKIHTVSRGICKTNIGELSDCVCTPTLFTSNKKYRLEGFFVKNGIIYRREINEEYVRELYERYSVLEKRVAKSEAEIKKIHAVINQKINF